MLRVLIRAGVLAVLCGTGCQSCAQSTLYTLSAGTINDPSNRTLRRDIMRYGISQFCVEMLKHNAPLKLADDQPVIGRFYPQSCQAKEIDGGDLQVSLGGPGYAWTNLTKRITFDMSATVIYDQDFQMGDGGVMYAYFRTKQVVKNDFKTRMIEQPAASFLNQLTPVGDNFGKQLVQGKLAEGFTVIRQKNGAADFGLGIVEVGKTPSKPYDVHGSSRIAYENTRTEMHEQQRDFIGPIVIEDSGRAIFFTGQLDGVTAIDVLVMRKDEAEASLAYYFNYAQAGPLAAQPMNSDIMQGGVQYIRSWPVQKGSYYIVLDHTNTAGQVAPPGNPMDDRAAHVAYVVQVGDAP